MVYGGISNQSDSGNAGGNNASCFPLSNLSPEEITLTAAVFAIALGETMAVDDAALLSFFLSTLAGNLGLFLEQKRRGAEPLIPGE